MVRLFGRICFNGAASLLFSMGSSYAQERDLNDPEECPPSSYEIQFEDHFSELPVDDQLTAYLCGMRQHPPMGATSRFTLTRQGHKVVPALVARFRDLVDDFDRENLAVLLAAIAGDTGLPDGPAIGKELERHIAQTPVTDALQRARTLELLAFVSSPELPLQCKPFETLLDAHDPTERLRGMQHLSVEAQMRVYLCSTYLEPIHGMFDHHLLQLHDHALLRQITLEELEQAQDDHARMDLLHLLYLVTAQGQPIGVDTLRRLRDITGGMTLEYARVQGEHWLGEIEAIVMPYRLSCTLQAVSARGEDSDGGRWNPTSVAVEGDSIPAEEYVVYEAVLEQLPDIRRSTPVIIEAHTRHDSRDIGLVQSDLAAKDDPLTQTIITDFSAKNAKSYRLADVFDCRGQVTVLQLSECADVHRQYGTSARIITFSRVGFEVARRKALVYVKDRAHLSLDAYYMVTENDGGVWRVTHSVRTMALRV